jgi:site-specific DNA-methyltransferase (adenine-specific)
MQETILLSDIVVVDRIRNDLGDVDSLVNSIRVYGIIQPIIIERGSKKLVAGGRRLEALKRLGIKELEHARDFVWRGEEDELHRIGAEIEENIKRKDLSWTEQIIGKQKLLEIMKKIHGEVSQGRPLQHGPLAQEQGFGVNKLASLLGESKATTSRDLQIAEAITALPQLEKCDTKEGAFRKMQLLKTVIAITLAARKKKEEQVAANTNGLEVQDTSWTLYEGDFRDNVSKIGDQSVDFIHTDLPYGANVEKMSAHVSSPGFDDSRTGAVGLLSDVARESYRTLRQDRYAAFWFGFNYYGEIVDALRTAGFTVADVPLIWIKNTKSGENPNGRYSNGYEACLIAVKGTPYLMRPGATNVKTFSVVLSEDKTHVAEKPVELVRDIIVDLCPPHGLVVDFCAGTGSTGVAALQHKCEVILFEKARLFCSIIRSKLALVASQVSQTKDTLSNVIATDMPKIHDHQNTLVSTEKL